MSTPYTIHTFDELFNGHIIENPTGDANAIYYVFRIGERTYLQCHDPFKEGHMPLYKKDTDIIEKHIAETEAMFTPDAELPEVKRARVKKAFLEASDEEFSTDLLEGEIFSGQELGDMLNQKLCGGNIYKEMQLHREVLDMFLPFLVSTFGDKLSKDQLGKLEEIQTLGTRVKTLLSHF